MTSMAPNRLTRLQVQEKFKRNFQALCARCPQLGKNQETLDDSLTSLQWLWNLNVNISGPTEQSGKSESTQRNGVILPPFPRNVISTPESNAGLTTTTSPQSLGPVGKLNVASRTNTFDPSRANTIKPGSHPPSASRATARYVRKTSAPITGRPVPPAQIDVTGRAISTSASPSKVHRQVLTHPVQSGCLPNTSNAGNCSRRRSPTLGLLKSDSPENVKMETAQTSQLPRIQTATHSNVKRSQPADDNETFLSDASASRNYSFSPREAMLDLLPSQVDYKNNSFVKPSFSYTTLICMAMQSNKRRRMTFPAICKWITDNFMYYRYAEPSWQNSVRLNLTQSKYFSKVHKKKDPMSKSCQWEISPNVSIKLRNVGSPLFNENPRRHSPRLEPVNSEISPSSSIALSSAQSLLMHLEADETFSIIGRKRKQTSPQKLVRRRSGSAKKRRDNSRTGTGNQNLLQEEAPELGSLKGDFNWNTIFDEFFDTPDAELSVTPTSMASRPSTNDSMETHDVISHFADDVVSGSLIAHDMLILPDVPESSINDENQVSKSSSSHSTESVAASSRKSVFNRHLHPPCHHDLVLDHTKPSSSTSDLPLIDDCNLQFPDDHQDSELDPINGFLKDVDDLDLTITGHQISPPVDWVPVCLELDAILCEKQNDNMFENLSPSTSNAVERLLGAPASPPHNNLDQYLSPRKSNDQGGRKTKRTGSAFPGSSTFSPQQHVSSPHSPRRSWQDASELTDTIDSMLCSSLQCD